MSQAKWSIIIVTPVKTGVHLFGGAAQKMDSGLDQKTVF
jgi:hypothetical protein